jgi:Rrf2 family protein
MISRTAKYALGILGYLAQRPRERVSGVQIANDIGVPANYLSKILNQLRKHGIVDAKKGWGGGFRLSARAKRRPIRDVLVLIDGAESMGPRECLFGLPDCDVANPCPLHPYWEEIQEIHTEMATSVAIGDLAR